MGETEDYSKFNLSYFTGKITAVEEITVDDKTGIVYEQDINFQFENGMILSIQDNDIQCKTEDTGKEKCVQLITGFHSPIEKCTDNPQKTGFFYNPVNQYHEPTIRGIIKKIFIPSVEKYVPFRRYAILDVGMGEILLLLEKDDQEDFLQFHEGDFVLIKEGLLAVLDAK